MDKKKSEEDCRTIMVAAGKLLEQGVIRLVADATAAEVGHRLVSIQQHARSEAKKTAEHKTQDMKKELEQEKLRMSVKKSTLDQEAKDLEAIRKKTTSSTETAKENNAEVEMKIDALLNKMEALVKTTEEHSKKLESLKCGKTVRAAPAWGDDFGEPMGFNYCIDMAGAPSYATVARGSGFQGITQRQKQDRVVSHAPNFDKAKNTEDKRDKQLLLEGEETEGTNAMLGLTDTTAFDKAKEALDKLVEEASDTGRPTSIEIVSVKVQRGKGLLIEMSTKEEKDWLIRPDICEKYAVLMGLAAKYRPRKYPILAEGVPVEFDINKEDAIEQLEQDNGFNKGDILGLRWIRNPGNRGPTQRHAHLIINCSSKQVANSWIRHRKLIGGKEVESSKLIADAFRCFKCQHYGHKAFQCHSEQRCGTCGQNHDTKQCGKHNSEDMFCVTCNESGHPTWSKSCPGYYVKSSSQSDKVADRYYTYYITDDPETWVLAANRIRSQIFKPANEPRPTFIPNQQWLNRHAPVRPTVQIPTGTPTSAPATPHPRPDNLAQPEPGGTVIAPTRQSTLFSVGWGNPTLPPRSSAPATQIASTQPTNSVINAI